MLSDSDDTFVELPDTVDIKDEEVENLGINDDDDDEVLAGLVTMDYETFASLEGHRYPYCMLTATDNMYDLYSCKWLFFEKDEKNEFDEDMDVRWIESKCIKEPALVTQLIITKSCLPLPPAYNDIAEGMCWWGKKQDPAWEQDVIDYLHQTVKYGKIPPPLSEVFEKCIARLLLFKANYVYRKKSVRNIRFQNELMSKWSTCFKFHYKHVTDDFITLAKRSMKFFDTFYKEVNIDYPNADHVGAGANPLYVRTGAPNPLLWRYDSLSNRMEIEDIAFAHAGKNGVALEDIGVARNKENDASSTTCLYSPRP